MDRDCENCANHAEGGCTKWECEYSPKEEARTQMSSADCISRQDAIDAIDKIFPADPMRNDYTQGITCGAALAEEYIKQLPSTQPKHLVKESGDLVKDLVNDCINRQDAIEDAYQWLGKKSSSPEWQELKQRIDNLPSTETTGHWWHYEGELECSVCGARFYDEIMEYTGDEVPKHCPDCGARMGGKDE